MKQNNNIDSTIQDAIKNNPSYRKRLMKYYFQCLASEGSKIIIFTIFFWRWNRLNEYLVALLMLILLRTNGGGIHLKHYTSCFLLSFSMLLGSILLAMQIFLPTLLMVIITLFCAIIGYLVAPITSDNRPAASDIVIRKSKRNTLLIICGYILLICTVPNNLYINIGFWTLTLHICQLLLAKILKERRTMKCLNSY